jgi:hypothetical protein
VKKSIALASAIVTIALVGGCGQSQLSQSQIQSSGPIAGRTVGLSAGDSLGMTFARDRQILALRARESNQPQFATVDGHDIPVNPGE